METFEKRLKRHIAIEFLYNRSKRRLALFEECWRPGLVAEQYGLFDGVERVASHIARAISKDNKRYMKPFKVRHWFAKSVKIVPYIGNDAGYTSEESSFNQQEGKFDEITIHVGDSLFNDNRLMSFIAHELTHAYEDYNLRLKGNNLIDNNLHTGYPTIIGNLTELKKIIYNVLYYLHSAERNAHIAQVENEIVSSKKRFTSIGDIFDYLRNTMIIKNYGIVFRTAKFYANFEGEQEQRNVLSALNDVAGYSFKNYSSMRRWLLDRVDKCEKKIISTICKFAYDRYKVVGMMRDSPNKLFEEVKFEKLFEKERLTNFNRINLFDKD